MCVRPWILAVLLLAALSAVCDGEYRRVCYMADWSGERAASFTVSDIDVTLCTHIILAFASVQSSYNSLVPLNPADAVQGGIYDQLANLRDLNPSLKIILAVGGWKHGSGPFSEVVSNPDRMDLFVNNVINYIRAIRFDGVDIDWEWPTERGSVPQDRGRFSDLLEKLRARIDAESLQTQRPALLLSIAVGASKYIIDASYEIDRISRAVDFMSVMTYDLNLSRGSRLLHHAPLYSRPGDPDEDQENSVQFSIDYWLNKGAPREKIMMGVPFYGRFYKLLSPILTQLYDDAAGPSSSYSYYQICGFAQDGGWTRVFDGVSKVPYIYNNDEWIGYDDVQSIELKARFIREKRLGGAMIWDVGQDDFNGTFCNQGRFPLLRTISQVLTASRDACPAGTYGLLEVSGCQICPRGYYQPQTSRTLCLSCGQGRTTYIEGSTDEFACVDTCPAGFEYSFVTGNCSKCDTGYVRADLSSAYCQRCPNGYTTLGAGAASCVPLPDGVTVPEILYATYHFTLQFETVKCDNEDVVVGAITAGIWRVMSDASASWVDLCSTGCDNVKTLGVEGCETRGGSARRRRKRNGQTVTLGVRAVVENVPEAVWSLTPSGNLTRTLDSVMTELFHNRSIFNTLEIYGIQYTGLTNRSINKICNKTGIVFENGECVPCPAGSFKQRTTRTCAVCSFGHYQDAPGRESCKRCPGPTSTLGAGADSVDMCLSPCALNESYCGEKGNCQWDQEALKVSCLCEDPYYGERCENIFVSKQSSIGPIIGGIVGGLGTIIFIVIVMVVCCVSQRRNKRRTTYNSSDVMFAPNVMNADFMPTPTVISGDPFYFDNPMVYTTHRNQGESKTPKIIQLSDTESEAQSELKFPKRDVTTTLSSYSEGHKGSNISVVDAQSSIDKPNGTAGASASTSKDTAPVEEDAKPAGSSGKQLFQRL